MNLSKFLKGTITMRELENMPNRYIQVIYKEYDTSLRDPKRKAMMEDEAITDEIEDAMGG